MNALMPFQEALSAVRTAAREARAAAGAPMAAVPLAEALGRVLAQEVVSPIDSPPFDKSAMDGFAVTAGEGFSELRVRETIAAGQAPGRALGPGECARIMTGAMLPPGAVRVIRKEYVQERNGVVTPVRPEPGDNVVHRGSNLFRGDTLLRPRVLSARDIGVLAASGVPEVQVAVPPATGIICTGPEIRAPGQQLGPGEIYDSNGPQLAAQLEAMRCPCRLLGTVPDEPGPLRDSLAAALGCFGLVLLTGGVSEGDFDFVPRSLLDVGAEVIIHGVAVKPGKPLLVARRGGSWIFGLPGNPVSTYVIFEVFVRPFLYGAMGLDWDPPLLRAKLGRALRRKGVERTEFLPVRVAGGVALPVAFHGSAHLNALADADGLATVPQGVSELPEGLEIDVRQL